MALTGRDTFKAVGFPHIATPFAQPAPGPGALAAYHAALAAEAAYVRDHAWVPATTAAREKVEAEMRQWLVSHPLQRTMQNAQPEDVVLFMRCCWEPQHTGYVLPDGSQIAAPGSVKGAIAHLTTAFDLLGREGPYMGRTGNPARGAYVELHVRSYERDMVQRGYVQGSAVPLSQEKLRALIDYLDRVRSTTTDPFFQLMIDRDITAFLYLWEGSQRGWECGKLTLPELCHAAERSTRSALPSRRSCPRQRLQLVPRRH